MSAAAQKIVNRPATRSAPTTPVRVRIMPGSPQAASALKVSSPHDPAEKEAEQTAKRIMRMPAAHVSAGTPAMLRSPHALRFAGAIVQRELPGIARKQEGQADVSANMAAEIGSSQAGGSPLPPSVRRFMEPRFGADFSRVRLHSGERAARMSRQLSAQAFTVGNQIFFGRDRFQPDSQEGRELIAHELTHTIQQGCASQQPDSVRRSADGGVSERVPPQVQRLGISDALDYFADKANNIPGFRMFTIVLGVNPINMSRVDRTPANLMRAVVEFLPGGHLITQALDNHGVFDKVAGWVTQQIATLGMVGSAIRRGIDQLLDSLGWRDIFDLGGVWNRAKSIFTTPIDQLISFAKGLASGIINFIKDAILMPIAALAQGTRGYDLLCAVLGKDPITGKSVAQDANALIGGFMKLIGQEEVWANMQKANAVARAWAWFKGAMSALLGFLRQIPTLFINAFKALEIADIILVPRAFAKLVGVFGNFVGSFIGWGLNAVWNLLEIIFAVVSPGALGYIKRTGAALKSILKNPLPFVKNLAAAGKLGFQQFADRFGTHLKAGLIDWLTGSLPGVYIPTSFALGEIVKFVFSVLGLTWQNIRGKLVKVVGETAVKAMETGFDIVATLVTQGPAAAWDKIKDQLASLKDTVIGGIISMVIEMIAKKAIPKIVAMFIPGAGFISAILSIYDLVMVVVSKLSKIAQVGAAFVNSIVQIAAGAIGAAANKVESVLAGLLSLAISFLAGFAGLGKVADKVMGVINKVRAPIDKALDALIGWIVRMAKAFVGKLRSAAGKLFNWAATKSGFKDDEGRGHSIYVQAGGGAPKLMIASDPMAAGQFLDFYVNKKGADFRKDNADKIGAVRTAITAAQRIVDQIDAAQRSGKDEAALQPLQQSLLEQNVVISGALAKLIDSDASIGKAREKYLLEGLTGTYGSMPKPKGDSFTADHQPQAAILEAAAEFDYFSDTGQLAKRAAGRAKQGYAINLHYLRHKAGRTYGSKGKATKEAFLAQIKPLVQGKRPAQQRSIVVTQIKADLLLDVAAMKGAAAPGSPNWTDIKELSGKKEAKDKLIGEISGRIVSGESQIAAQNIDTLVN
jgi:hypothetical protein